MNEHNDIEQRQDAPCCAVETEGSRRRTWTYTPHVDITELDDAYTIEADLPGVDQAQIDLAVEDDILTIQAPVVSRDHGRARVTRHEYGVGNFHRRFRLDRTVDVSRIDATYDHGVLTVRLPKAAESRSRRIEVR